MSISRGNNQGYNLLYESSLLDTEIYLFGNIDNMIHTVMYQRFLTSLCLLFMKTVTYFPFDTKLLLVSTYTYKDLISKSAVVVYAFLEVYIVHDLPW